VKRTGMQERKNNEEPESRRLAAYRQLIARLPITLRPSLSQQLGEWNTLFPFEQNRFAEFLRGIGSFQPSALDALTDPLRKLETKMGVQNWNFSQTGDTLENASLLARSEYYSEWRGWVQKIFEAVDEAARDSAPVQAKPTRFVLLILPKSLPIDSSSVWQQWDPRGRVITIEGDSRKLIELVMQGGPDLPGIASLLTRQGGTESSDLWLIDAEVQPGEFLVKPSTIASSALSYTALRPFRDRFLAELNTIPKDIQATDQIIAALRHKDWELSWSNQLVEQPRLRSFVVDLFLSGNGALIFSNAFVEWAACEALRRARPRVLIARFGMRSKPKPFTSIAIFENQQTINSLPDIDDPENSATDAMILARYVWLAATRYPEQEQTICLCVSEYRNSAYVIPLAGKSPEWSPARAVTPEEVYGWIAAQVVTQVSSA
jgi:hypothetical protein